MMTTNKRRVGIMVDTESLALEPKAVMLQVAFIAFDEDDPEIILREVEEYLPIQPQLTLGRKISADTIIWWMNQPDAARSKFSQNAGNDFEELTALVSSVNRKMEQVIQEADSYEIYARGTQHDLPMIASLWDDLGMAVPWHYDRPSDLKTIMKEAGVGKYDVAPRPGLVMHHALSDCRNQIDCLLEARRHLRAKV